MPRSLISCYDNVVRCLDSLSQAYGRQGASQRLAHKIMAQLENSSIETLFQDGLHEFITGFLDNNNSTGWPRSRSNIWYKAACVFDFVTPSDFALPIRPGTYRPSSG